MQPILVIAALAVGAGLLSTGFLATNTIQIWTQDTGFGEADIETPIKHANIDFVVDKIEVDLDTSVVGDEYYKNNIVACSFHTFEDIEDGVEVVCKLQAWDYESQTNPEFQDGGQVVVCEGRAIFEGYEPVQQWLAQKKPDVLFIIFNDHVTSFFFDHYSAFVLGIGDSYEVADEGGGARNLPAIKGHPGLAAHIG